MTTNSLDPSHAVHRLLFRALLEMRSQGHEHQDKVVFHLADLFHTVALDMERAARGECGYGEVMQHLQQRASEKGLRKWLDSNLAAVASAPAASTPKP
jgi:hypothetical protein